MEATVHDSERYRSNAADCLSEAHDVGHPDHSNLNLFTAAAWLSLARQDEAIESVIASWNTPKVPEPRMAPFIFQGVLGCFGQPFLAPQMLPIEFNNLTETMLEVGTQQSQVSALSLDADERAGYIARNPFARSTASLSGMVRLMGADPTLATELRRQTEILGVNSLPAPSMVNDESINPQGHSLEV
jgi:hypothetical protein